jgi:hypothetical protein
MTLREAVITKCHPERSSNMFVIGFAVITTCCVIGFAVIVHSTYGIPPPAG